MDLETCPGSGCPGAGKVPPLAWGCRALQGGTEAGIISKERDAEQRGPFPIINKAVAPSILMSQGGRNQGQAAGT